MGGSPDGGLPDVVYVTKQHRDNDELRVSLRSLCNLPHGRVWLVGHKPGWATNVEHLPTRNSLPSKYENSTANLLTACTHDEVSETFHYFNDDFYVLEPIEEIPVAHRGPVDGVYHDLVTRYGSMRGVYREGMAATKKLLEAWGYPNPLSYELHIPMTLNKRLMVDAVRRASEDSKITALHKRTLYGNTYQIGGVFMEDVKVNDHDETWAKGQQFVSTSNPTFTSGKVGADLRGRFHEPGPYEC